MASDFPGGGIESTVVEMLQELLTQPKVIRHIQRGVGSTQGNITIDLLGFNNQDKMIALIDGGSLNTAESGSGLAQLPRLTGLTNSSLTIYAGYWVTSGSTAKAAFSYQVIEFC